MELGSYVWFIGLGLGLVLLAAMFAYGRMRGRPARGNPNAAWEQAAAETGHPEVARPPASAPPPR